MSILKLCFASFFVTGLIWTASTVHQIRFPDSQPGQLVSSTILGLDECGNPACRIETDYGTVTVPHRVYREHQAGDQLSLLVWRHPLFHEMVVQSQCAEGACLNGKESRK